MACWTRKARSKVLHWSPWLCFWRGKAWANYDPLVKMSSLPMFVWPTGHGFFVCFKDKVRSQSGHGLRTEWFYPVHSFTERMASLLRSSTEWKATIMEIIHGGGVRGYMCVCVCTLVVWCPAFFVETRGQLLTVGSPLHFIFEAQSALFFLLGCMLHT